MTILDRYDPAPPIQAPLWSQDSRLIYELIAPRGEASSWGVLVWDVSLDRSVRLYGFASADLASAWIEIHSATTDLAEFPHLRMSRAMYGWSQKTGIELPDGEAERVSDAL